MTGSLATRRQLMELADTGARKVGLEAGTALVQLPKVAAAVLQEMTGEPVMAYMAMGEEDVLALREFVSARLGLTDPAASQEGPTHDP